MKDQLLRAIAMLAARTPTLSRQVFEAALYLVDLEIFHRTGATLSGSTWRRLGVWPEVDGFAEALDELTDQGAILWAPEGICWTGSLDRVDPPAVHDGLTLIVDLVGRCDRAELAAIVVATSPFGATAEAGYGSELPFERNPRPAPRSAPADPAAYAAFKQGELARVSDLIERALAAPEEDRPDTESL